jgi:hypothetical protein
MEKIKTNSEQKRFGLKMTIITIVAVFLTVISTLVTSGALFLGTNGSQNGLVTIFFLVIFIFPVIELTTLYFAWKEKSIFVGIGALVLPFLPFPLLMLVSILHISGLLH